MKIKKPKITNVVFENCKELIKLYIHTGDKINYPREIKIAKKLLKLIPDILFWRQYDPDRKFHSLSIFLTKECKKHLDKEYNMWKMINVKQPTVILESKPVIDLKELNINKKQTRPRNLMEFVDDIL